MEASLGRKSWISQGAISLVCLFFALLASPVLSASSNPNGFITFQSFKTHSRISFRVDSQVPVEWRETPTGFTAFFKGMTLVDFGAPFGDEERWVSSFSSFENPMNHQGVASIRFRETSGGVRIEGTWRFASGPDAPAEPRMESFSYREAAAGSGGPRFVADFWTPAGPTVAEIRARSAEEAKSLALTRAHSEIERRSQRRIASLKAKEELDDLTHFCRVPLADGRDIFLPLLPVHEKIDFVKFLPTTAPDERYDYFRPEGNERDAQYVRLALDLYKSGKWALAIRTLDFLDSEFPGSAYRGDMHFLRANALIKLGMQAEGERLLEEVRLESKGMPPALHAALYLSAKVLAKNSPLATEEAFSWLIQNYPGHPLSWLFHLAVAESLYDLEQTERATAEYQWVADKAPALARTPDFQDYRAVAAFRIGDLYLKRGQYAEALGAYVSAKRQFPKQSEGNPAFLLNRAEALTGLGKYEEARADFQSYLKEFPAYPKGWRATLRLGEIDARLGDAGSQSDARHWYYETINRYPFSPGSTLARLRLLPCGDHGKFTAQAADRFFSGEAKDFTNAPEVSAEVATQIANDNRYADFLTEARIRTLIGFGKDEAALDTLLAARPTVQSPEVQKELKRTEGVLFRRMILTRLHPERAERASQANGKAAPAPTPTIEDQYAALKFYEDRHASAEEAGSVVDPDYLLELSHVAANLGLGSLAQEFAEKYRKASSEGRTVAEAPLGIDEKLQASEERFAEAKALWVRNQDDAESLQKQYDTICKKLDQVVTESRYALQKEVILGLLEQKLKKPTTALGHVAKAELLASTSHSGSAGLRQIRAWLASLQAETGDFSAALDVYRKLEVPAQAHSDSAPAAAAASDPALAALGVAAAPSGEQVLLAEGMILDRKSRWGEAVAVYSKAVDQGVGGNQAKYGLARALLHEGGAANRKKALGMLEEVSTSKAPGGNPDQDFWKDLAAKTLEVERGT